MTGTTSLLRLVLRRDRVRLPVWVLAVVALVYASVEAVANTYATPQEIHGYASTMGSSPAAVAMAGPPVALDTVGGIAVNETGVSALVGVALMTIFLVVRHTRAEEEEGRTEVLRSTVVGRHAPMAAALLESVAASVLVGAGVALSVATLDVPAGGVLLYGAAVACMGIVFAGVAAVTAQLTAHARGATGLSLTVLAISFLLRAVGDVQGSWLSWVSPMGWSQQVTAFGEPRWWPLAFSLVLTALAIAAAVALAGRRDLGAGIVAARPGPAGAVPRLGTPVGLAWRLQRGSVLGWTVGIFLGSAAFGSFSREVSSMVESNPELADFFAQSGQADLVESFLSSALLIMNLIGAGFAISSALRLRAEETSGRLEPVLATGVSRGRWLLGGLLVTLAGSLIVVAAAGLGTGLAHGIVTDDPDAVVRMLGYSLVYLPAVLVLAAVTVLLFGWVPRLAAVAWVTLAISFVIGYLGQLGFPAWFENLSPFTHTPAVPVSTVTVAPLATMTVVVVLACALGLVGFRRRDIG
ncbi:MAG TPA: ABC transporter permease [Nocardioidaceae bacterium]|nr:ABC transporter permease [Nocardioidaceae bacterium]